MLHLGRTSAASDAMSGRGVPVHNDTGPKASDQITKVIEKPN